MNPFVTNLIGNANYLWENYKYCFSIVCRANT